MTAKLTNSLGMCHQKTRKAPGRLNAPRPRPPRNKHSGFAGSLPNWCFLEAEEVYLAEIAPD